MSRWSEILIFIAVNALGFFSAPLCYLVGVKTGMLQLSDPALDPAQVRLLFGTIMMTWVVCAIFSLGFFFFKGKIKLLFALAPAVIPAAYGFRVLLLL